MGGKSSSSTSSNTTTHYTDSRKAVADQGVLLESGGDLIVTTTDGGAVQAGTAIAVSALEYAAAQDQRAQDLINAALANQAQSAESALSALAAGHAEGYGITRDVVKDGWSFANATMDKFVQVQSAANDLIDDANDSAFETSQIAINKMYEAGRPAGEGVISDLVKYGSMAAAAIAVAQLLSK